MCLLICLYRMVTGYPVVVGANRDEAVERPGLPPAARDGLPRIVCPTDPVAGGTWLGVNEHGLLVAVTDRPTPQPDPSRRSRGLLCLDALRCHTADEGKEMALTACEGNPYNHFNLLLADPSRATVIHYGGSPRIAALAPGCHVLANGDVDDESIPKIRRARGLLGEVPREIEEAVSRLKHVLRDHGTSGSVEDSARLHGERVRTLSSSILAIKRTHLEQCIFLHADGTPCCGDYSDISHLLR